MTRRNTQDNAATMALLRARHRRQQLVKVARELYDPTLTAERLRDHSRYEGLEPSLADCADVLAEVYRLPPRARPANGLGARVLAVARTLAAPFTLNDLIVGCWTAAPELFGLDGYPQFPAEHRVRCCIWGRRGLVAQGCLVREPEERWRVAGE